MRPGSRSPARGLSAGLRWLLLGSVLLSVWAVLDPQSSTEGVVEAVALQAVPANVALPAEGQTRTGLTSPPASKPEFGVSDFDPFVGQIEVPARLPTRALVAAPTAAVLAPPRTARPPLDAKFAGRLVDPEGRATVYLSLREQTIVAAVGLQLAGGYIIDAITPTEVRVRPQDTVANETLSIPIPHFGADGR